MNIFKNAEVIDVREPFLSQQIVICDICNDDYTDSKEEGGFLFGSYAYCPKCALTGMKSIIKHNEQNHVNDVARAGETFKDFVVRIRKHD